MSLLCVGSPIFISIVPDTEYQRVNTHIVHDDVKSGDTVRGDKQQLVGILLIWERVDIPDFAFCQQLQFGHVGGSELRVGA